MAVCGLEMDRQEIRVMAGKTTCYFLSVKFDGYQPG
jgi:hypothetical protein